MRAVGRPGRRAVVALVVGHGRLGAAGQGLHVDHGLAGMKAHIGQARAVGRPGRRDDGLARTQRHLRVLPVGVGDLQFVGAALLEHIGNAGGEHTAHAGDLLINTVGDLVRHAAQLLRGAVEGHAVELRLLDVVAQAVADLVAAVGCLLDAAISQVVGAATAPIVVRDRAVDVEVGAGGVDQAELARAVQVGADHVGNGLAGGVGGCEVGDGDRVLGGPDARDIDLQLRARGLRGQQGRRQQEREAQRA